MQKILIISGLIIFVIGILYSFFQKIPLGRLPGDIFYQSDKFSIIFPIITCLIISIILTILLNFFR
ncbi:MAG: DUF2905 family protein [Pseudomonadota bacterium]|nr:DUF2905 family protein [Pseudomonadota bacterium]